MQSSSWIEGYYNDIWFQLSFEGEKVGDFLICDEVSFISWMNFCILSVLDELLDLLTQILQPVGDTVCRATQKQ